MLMEADMTTNECVPTQQLFCQSQTVHFVCMNITGPLLKIISVMTQNNNLSSEINGREYQNGNQKWTIQRNG